MKEAKQHSRSDFGSLCQKLKTITDYKAPTSSMTSANVSLADELNTFYARFKAAANDASAGNANSDISCKQKVSASTGNAFIISKHDVRRALRRVNTRKAAGPDSISGLSSKPAQTS